MRRLSLLVLVVPGLHGCLTGGCDNVVSQVVPSPGGVHDAVVFSLECGATSGFTTQLSIIRSGASLPNKPGNTLVLDDKVNLALTWAGDAELVVAYSASSTPFTKEAMVSDVRVRYAPQAL